jgi:hypothetical protein
MQLSFDPPPSPIHNVAKQWKRMDVVVTDDRSSNLSARVIQDGVLGTEMVRRSSASFQWMHSLVRAELGSYTEKIVFHYRTRQHVGESTMDTTSGLFDIP